MSDEREFELLDQYVRRLHTGTDAEREQVLAEHPELKSAVRCLEALEKLAPRSGTGREDASGSRGAVQHLSSAGSGDESDVG